MTIPRMAAVAGLLLALVTIAAGPASAAAAKPSSPASAARSAAGPAWAVQRTPSPAKAYDSLLTAVSCASATACTAVGYAYENPKSELPLAFAEAWNGAQWSLQTTPRLAGSAFSEFSGVSCASATACTAVGDSAGDPLVERWNGTSWSVQSLPLPAGASNADLFAVSCASATACTAAGDYYVANKLHYTLAEVWHGTTWSVQATPNPKGAGGGSNVNNGSRLLGVSCASVTACTAVGLYVNNAQDEFTLAERWNGASWSIQHTPNREAITGLDGISCASATACTATGFTENHHFVSKTLAEAWHDVTWSVQATPSPPDVELSGLNSLSCTSATACTAAGSGGANTLAEAWNGTRWSVQATLNPGAAQQDVNNFYGVSCTSPTACTAVGEHVTGGAEVPLAERYSPLTPAARSSRTGAGERA
jgi:hypothetical protein